MGHHRVENPDEHERRIYARAILEDLEALDRMCEEGIIESGVRRVGAEQEMFLARPNGMPALIALEVLKRLDDPSFTTELGLFNLEHNLSPSPFGGSCLREMEEQLEAAVARVRRAAHAEGGEVLLTGILPTLGREHLTTEAMTPLPRYRALNRAMVGLVGGTFRTAIRGLDDLQITHSNVMLEATSTSFQVHFQVGAEEFPRLYNLAQVVTAPVLAAAVNSPLLMQHRLWHETRIAVFERSIDFRSEALKSRGAQQRVTFGEGWVQHSVAEIFREGVARFRVLVTGEVDESPLAVLERGETPLLRALSLHNGTVYRWNRPCYGVLDGRPHLRIEARALPAGPTIVDEVANAAFYFGLMAQMAAHNLDVSAHMSFDDAKGNFLAAAHSGLDARFRWLEGRELGARDLIMDHLLGEADAGLSRSGIDAGDRRRYLSVIEERVGNGRTGARWALESLAKMDGIESRSERCRVITEAMVNHQRSGKPVHEWPLVEGSQVGDWRGQCQVVGQLMTTDLFTVDPEDLLDVAANLMQWVHIRHVPVEDHEGRLVGLLTHRMILKHLSQRSNNASSDPAPVKSLMRTDLATVSPETTCAEALQLMRDRRVSGLPVVSEGKLVGIVTERDFLGMALELLKNRAARDTASDE